MTTGPHDQEHARLLERLFEADEDALSDHAAAEVADAIGGDDELRLLYNRLAVVDRELDGDFEETFGEAVFLSRLDEMLEEETTTPTDVVSLDDRRGNYGAWIALAAVVLLSVTAALLSWNARQSPGGDEFRPRSTVTPQATDGLRVEVFCVERGDDGVTFRGSEENSFGVVKCPLDAEIKLALRNPDRTLRHAAFFGVAEDGTIYWYGPSPAAPGPVTVAASHDTQPVGETVRLSVNHEPGLVRVYAMADDEPLSMDEVREVVETHREDLHEKHHELASPDGRTDSTLFEVVETP